jgi:hypothetical protein
MCFVIKEGFALYIFDLRLTISLKTTFFEKIMISRAKFRDSNGAELNPADYSTEIQIYYMCFAILCRSVL